MPENQNIEWKENWRDEYLKWISGFANAKGGKMIIGKSDNGEIVGVKDSKRLMDDIPNKIQTHLGIICDIELLEYDNKQYLEINVKPHDIPISYHGKYYYRSGSTKQELKGNSLNEFLLKKRGKTWGDIIEPNASLSDIDNNSVERFVNDARKSKRLPSIKKTDIKQIFQNLQLIEGEELKRAAVLLFGKEPHRFFIGAFAKIGKFGKTDHDLRSQEVVEGNAYGLADQILEILDKKYFVKDISYEGLHRVESTPYPYEAIREALINAIIHRTYIATPIQISLYDDKIMIWNAGELPEQLSIEDLKKKHASFPKNPRLADVFFKGGLIEAWGRGTLKIIDECKNYGLPEPQIEYVSGGINVTIYRDSFSGQYLKEQGLNDRQLKAIDYLKEKGRITNSEYQKINDISRETATRDLKSLVESTLIKAIGTKGAGSFYVLN